MVVDLVQALAKTSRIMVPTPSSVAPIPTVVPDLPEYQHVGHSGKTALWVVFVIMIISSVIFAGMSWRVPVSKRLYYVITTLITIFASLSYFAMATGHGVSYNHVRVRHSHSHVPDTFHDVYRQVFWARYVDWSLTTPLILIDLGLLAGLSGAHLLIAIIADVIMILTGMFAALGSEGTPQKWGWYAIGCISYLVVIWHLAVNGRAQAKAKGSKVGQFFIAITGFTIIVWTAYPIVWGIASGARKMSVDSEIIAYAVLDILAKPVFGLWLLLTHAKMPETSLDLGGFWSNGVSREGTLRLDDDGA